MQLVSRENHTLEALPASKNGARSYLEVRFVSKIGLCNLISRQKPDCDPLGLGLGLGLLIGLLLLFIQRPAIPLFVDGFSSS